LLKETPFSLPPSGRLTAGVRVQPIAAVWGLDGLGGPLRGLLDFFSQMYVLNGLLTLNGKLVVDAGRHLILPVLVLSTVSMAVIARMTRSSLLEVMNLDYMRTARAKGLNERRIIFRHAMRNALLPVITVIGLSLGGLLSGAVLTETIFGLTGVGRTMFDAISSRDYGVIQGFTLVIAFTYVVVNLLVDISYAVLDPRIRLG
jgi:peptide/nickel transport system permease protein